MSYVLVRCFNNNVVEAADDNGRRIVLTGKGVGFGLAKGEVVPEDRIDLKYVPESDHDTDRVLDQLAQIPPRVLMLVRHASISGQESLGLDPSVSFELSLADHLMGALRRYDSRTQIDFPLYHEMTQLYPAELEFGRTVLKLVHARLGVILPEDEAGAFALHAVSHMFDSERAGVGETMAFTRAINASLTLIAEVSGTQITVGDPATARFVTHMRYLFGRLANDDNVSPGPEGVITAIQESLAHSWAIAGSITDVVREQTGYCLGKSERAYIALHVGRLIREK